MPELFERRGSEICIAVEWPGGTATWVDFETWIHSHIIVQFRGKNMILADLLQSLKLLYNTENTQEVGHNFH